METVTIGGRSYGVNTANVEVLATQTQLLEAERDRRAEAAGFWEATAKTAATIIAANRNTIKQPPGADAKRFLDALDQGAFTAPVGVATDGWWPYKLTFDVIAKATP